MPYADPIYHGLVGSKLQVKRIDSLLRVDYCSGHCVHHCSDYIDLGVLVKPMDPKKAAFRRTKRRNMEIVKALRSVKRWNSFSSDPRWELGTMHRGGYSIVLPARKGES